jgi:hypothetical protein
LRFEQVVLERLFAQPLPDLQLRRQPQADQGLVYSFGHVGLELCSKGFTLALKLIKD